MSLDRDVLALGHAVDKAHASEIADEVYRNFVSQMNRTGQLFDDVLVQRFFSTKVLVQFVGSMVWSMAAEGREEILLDELCEMTKFAMKSAKKEGV